MDIGETTNLGIFKVTAVTFKKKRVSLKFIQFWKRGEKDKNKMEIQKFKIII
jgi:hypothetical protein